MTLHLDPNRLCSECGQPLVREWLVYLHPAVRHANCDQYARAVRDTPDRFTTDGAAAVER